MKFIITEETACVISQVCKETKAWIHPNLRRQIPHLIIPLSSLTFVLLIQGPKEKGFC